MGTVQSTDLNTDTENVPTSGEFGDRGDGTSKWLHWFRVGDGGIAALGATTTAAVTDPATNTSLIGYIRGILTFLRVSAAGVGKREDDAHASQDTGVMALAVRRDAAAVSSGTTGDYEPLQTDALGRLRVTGPSLEDAAAASGDAGFPILAVRRDTPAAGSGTDGDYEVVQTDALGRVRVATPPIRSGGTAVTGASGNVANASAVATLAAGAAGVRTYITGFEVTAAGATAAAVVNVTVANTITGSLVYVFTVPAGATLAADPLVVAFPEPIPANADATAITVTLPALGAGNTNAAVVAHGFQR